MQNKICSYGKMGMALHRIGGVCVELSEWLFNHTHETQLMQLLPRTVVTDGTIFLKETIHVVFKNKLHESSPLFYPC